MFYSVNPAHKGGKSSGYGRDLRIDIYWAAAFKQDFPLGCGEFLFPYEPGLRHKEREVLYMMGLQTRGYRYADWFDIRPYNPFYTGYQSDEGVKPEHREAWDTIVKSFAPVAVFDKDYDALGPFPEPPVLEQGEDETRTLIVYNDTFEDERVTVEWEAVLDGRTIGSGSSALTIGLGDRAELEIAFTPKSAGKLELRLKSPKGGRVWCEDVREFLVR